MQLEDKYDVVILGSGMAGLASAMILGKEGYKVCVLEKNAQIGGTLQTFKRDKEKFDTGVHYVGGLEEGQPLFPYFHYLDILNDVNLVKMDTDGFDKISFDGDDNIYPHAQGYDNFIQQLTAFFPEEEEGLIKYIDGIKELCDKFRLYNIYSDKPPLSEIDLMSTGAKNFIDGCTTNHKLRQVLAGSNLLYAGEPDTTPFYVHALVINSYIQSSYKFKNGGSEISRSLNYSIKNLGGKIVRNAEVVKINHQNQQVESVSLKDGRKITGDIYISNIHPTETFKLVDQSQFRKSYVNRIMNLRNTISVFTLYLVMKPKTQKYFNHNRYHYQDVNVWGLTEYPLKNWGKDIAIFTLPSKDDPEYSNIVTVMAYMRMDEVSKWENTFNTTMQVSERSAEYQDFKEKKAQDLLERANQVLPGLKENTASYYTSTPLTQRDYLNTVDGGLYGVVRDYHFPLKSQINTKTKLKNLFLTGQNIILHGILGTTISAVVTCGEIIGRDKLVGKIRKSVLAKS